MAWFDSVCLLSYSGMEKQRLFTGMQPSGELHIGNYFGVMRPFLNMYEDYDSFFMVADYHALTSLRDSDALRRNILNLVRDFLAVGLDPERVVLFRQSDNPDHPELAWILNCVVTVPFLMQARSYKDKVAKGLEPNAGLFTYPLLQAADIVLYETSVVPVGEDQRQHLEYTREAVKKLNLTFGHWILKEPKEEIVKAVGVVPGTDGQKMSKSYGNTIPLFGTPEEIEKAVMSIVTDSAGDFPEHVFNIHRLLKSEKELRPIYDEHKGHYGELKKILSADLEAFIAPLRSQRAVITDGQIMEVLDAGGKKAREVSNRTMAKVRRAIGIKL